MGVLRSSWGRAAAVCAVAVACALPDAWAYKIFQAKLPNGGNVPGVAALGHERPDSGGPNNDFGLDFIGAMFKWSKELCEKDSDGDGQTNGQELGDPCCEFEHRKNERVQWTEGVSHPGDPDLTSDPKRWEGLVCGAGAGETQAQEETELEATEAEVEKEQEGPEETQAQEETELEATEAEAEKEQEEKDETELEAVQGDAELNVGAPMMRSSVMLSAVALTVMVVYLVVMRVGRRSARNLPIFRQRRGPM
ncbi:hypothetical protein PRIC1_014679 [Phytophthora ramorum]